MMAETSFTDRKVIAAAQNFVCVVAHRENAHGETEYVIDREKVKLCNEYYTINCKEHQKGESAIGRFFQGTFGTPTTVFCDPFGNELFRVRGGLAAGMLTNRMSDALAKVKGPKVSAAQWKFAQKMIADAKAHVEKKEYKKAISIYTKLGKMRGSTSFKKMSKEALGEINEEGVFLLAQATEIEDASKRKSAIRKISGEFRGLPVAKQAYEELRKKK